MPGLIWWIRGPFSMNLHKEVQRQGKQGGLLACQRGQAGIMVALILATAMLCVAFVAHTGELTLAKMQAQIAADAGAQTAAAILADGLNTVAIANVILVGGTLLVPITEGLSSVLTRGAHVAQEIAVNTTPALSVGLGEAAAISSGADLAIPTIVPQMHLQKAPLGYQDLLSVQDQNVRYVSFLTMKEPNSLATGFAGNLIENWQGSPLYAHAKGAVTWDGFGLEMIKSFIPGYQASLASNI